jgi:hypothetical protein
MSNTITNQKQQPTSVVEMDAGKFLHMINVGAQSQVTLFAERIAKLGEEVGQHWRLVSLDSAQLLFEDVGSNIYYVADISKISRNGGPKRVKIDNIRQVRVVESKKEGLFRKNLAELVDAINEDNTKQADDIFNRIAAQRFRSCVIPENGLVTTRDRTIRRIHVASSVLDEGTKLEIVNAIRDIVKDGVKVTRGRIVEAIYSDKPVMIPISEMTRRRVVARFLKEQAKNAYKYEGFQARVHDIAALISQDKVEEAVQNSAEFLMEEQQFCMLDLREMQELANNALATIGCMNATLADDVGRLLYRTNCRVNYNAIIEEWQETARRSEYAPLVENVRMLGESKLFEADYQSFLHMVFNEDVSTQEAKAKIYLAALKDMKNILTGSEKDADLASSLDNYITRLENIGNEPDDATLMEVEELVASVSEGLLKNLSDLKDYDQVPQPKATPPEEFGAQNLAGEPGEGEEMIGGGGGAGPALPLGEAEEPGAEEAAAPGEGEEPPPGEEEIPVEGKKAPGKVVTESKGIAQLEAKDLKSELLEWQKNGERFFAEDGVESCTAHLKACIKRANLLKESDLATGFNKLLAENTPLKDVEVEPYHYEATRDIKINRNYGLHEARDEGMEAKKGGTSTGGLGMQKIQGKNCAMGKAGEKDQNVSDYGHSSAILKGSGQKISDKKVAPPTKCESMDSAGNAICPECHGHFEPASCMTESGALCPECGADMGAQLLEMLSVEEIKGCGHKMDRVSDGKGVAATTLGKSDGRGGGTTAQSGSVGGKQRMDRISDGKGVAAISSQQSDGAKAGGKKDGMEGQEGKGVAELRQPANQGMRPIGLKKTAVSPKLREGKEISEGTQIQVTSTEPGEGLNDVTFNTERPIDQVVAGIADAMAQEPGDIVAGADVGGPEVPVGEPGAEGEPPVGGPPGDIGPEEIGAGMEEEPGAGGPPIEEPGAGGPPIEEPGAGGPPPEFGGEGAGEAEEEEEEEEEEAAEGEGGIKGGADIEEKEEEEPEGDKPEGGIKGGAGCMGKKACEKCGKEECTCPCEKCGKTECTCPKNEDAGAEGAPITEKKIKGVTSDGRKFKLKISKKEKKEGEEEEEEEEEEAEVEEESRTAEGQSIEERRAPPKEFQFKKKGDKGKKEEAGEEAEEAGETVKEDEDVTTPQGEDYTSEKAARKDGGEGIEPKSGKEMNPKPKFKKSDGKSGDAPARPVGK